MNRRSAIRALMGLPFMPLLARAAEPSSLAGVHRLPPGTIIDTAFSYQPGRMKAELTANIKPGDTISAERFNALINEVNCLKQRLA